MSERAAWIRLEDSWTWVDTEFGSWKRLNAGWLSIDGVLVTAFRTGRLRARGRSRRLVLQPISFEPVGAINVSVRSLVGRVTITSERRPLVPSSPFLMSDSEEFSEVEVSVADLHDYCRDILGAPLVGQEPAERVSSQEGHLGIAPAPRIRAAVRRAYRDAAAARCKPPNIKEVSGHVGPILLEQGLKASQRQIQSVAEEDEFRKLRGRPGVRFQR